jgi:hypothetical protein
MDPAHLLAVADGAEADPLEALGPGVMMYREMDMRFWLQQAEAEVTGPA